MKKIVVLATNGTEEAELIGIVDVLRRAEIPTLLVSTSTQKEFTTAHQIKITADVLWSEVDWSEVEMLVLPGGMGGVNAMKSDERVLQKLHEFHKNNQYIAAICAAPLVLMEAGILHQTKATCYPSCQPDLVCKEVITNSICFDGNILTAQSVAHTLGFALTIVELIAGTDKRKEVAKAMIYNDSTQIR